MKNSKTWSSSFSPMKTSTSFRCPMKSMLFWKRSHSTTKIQLMPLTFTRLQHPSTRGRERQEGATTYPWSRNGSKSSAPRASRSKLGSATRSYSSAGFSIAFITSDRSLRKRGVCLRLFRAPNSSKIRSLTGWKRGSRYADKDTTC